jgi:hypothetical protein
MLNDITSTALTTVGSTANDVLGLIGFCVLLIVWGAMQGREVLIATLFSLYPSMLITTYFPYQYLTGMPKAYARLLVFVFALAAIYVVVRRQLMSSFFMGGVWKWVEVFVLALCVVGVFGTALYHSVNIGTLYTFSPLFNTLFLSPIMHIAWLAGPLLCVPLVVRS